ncbi:MAG: carboxypeptidase-like regulatory domain-containing protein, partial [Candidatus Aminicenantes bacterium]|nr:carboxypeptidase-like regulatory domain-containing protein [Candidatus Aminicenantes bacterium]
MADDFASLTGIVRGEGGLPLFGVLVYLSDGRGSQVVGLTDRRGSYSFNKLHPGIYLMELELLDFPQVAQAKLVEVSAGNEVVVDFTLPGVYPLKRKGVEVGWVFRGGKRDIFRQRDTALSGGESGNDYWFIPLREVQLLTSVVVGEGAGASPVESKAMVELGQGAEQRWSVMAEMVERDLRWWRARGSYRWKAAERHEVEFGLSYRDHY